MVENKWNSKEEYEQWKTGGKKIASLPEKTENIGITSTHEKKCKHCAMMIPAEAKICPYCRKPQQTTAGTMGCAIILGAFLLFGMIGMCSSSKAPKAPAVAWNQQNNSIMAYIMFQRFVKEKLKSPSTAAFPSYNGHIIEAGNQSYRIDSYVDSQNGFGAMIRTRYSGEIEQTGPDKWRLISLQFIN